MPVNTAKVVNLPVKRESPAASNPIQRFLTLQDGSECIFTLGYHSEYRQLSAHILSDSADALVNMLREAASVLESGGLREEVK